MKLTTKSLLRSAPVLLQLRLSFLPRLVRLVSRFKNKITTRTKVRSKQLLLILLVLTLY
jgi:hypothetical protein